VENKREMGMQGEEARTPRPHASLSQAFFSL